MDSVINKPPTNSGVDMGMQNTDASKITYNANGAAVELQGFCSLCALHVGIGI